MEGAKSGDGVHGVARPRFVLLPLRLVRLRSRPLPVPVIYGLQALAALAIFIAGFGTLRFLYGWPLGAAGDVMHHVTLAKALIEQGWYWNIERLSAPFTLPMVMFPVQGTLDTIIYKVLALLTTDPFALVTRAFAVSFMLSSVTSAYVLHDLGLDRPTSLVFGLVFAFAPIPFVTHLMLVTYLVPFAIGFCVHLISGSFAALPGRRKIVYYAGAAALGLNYIYAAFFSCFFVVLACIAGLFRPRAPASLRYGVLFIGIVAGTWALTFVPALVAASKDPAGRAELYGHKSIAEVEIHGLKIKHLLLPSPSSAIPVVEWAYKKLTEGFPLEAENRTARLGIVGAIGFIVLMTAALLRLTRPRPAAGELNKCLGPLAALAIGGVFLATIGGLGSIFGAFVTVEIRAYNRISPFLLFLSVTAVAFCFSYLAARRSMAARAGLLAAILLIALLEQPEFKIVRTRSAAGFATIVDIEPVIATLERRLPKGAAVYQMPFTPYPHTPFVREMWPNDHLHAYAISHHLRWSWPALSGVAIAWNRELEKLPPAELAGTLAARGFSAIWINRSAYEDRANGLIEALKAAGLAPIAESARGTVIVLDLSAVRTQPSAPSESHRAIRVEPG